jgi:hypothetical protein
MEGATGGVEVKPGPARGIALPREDGYCDVIRPGIERETRSATRILRPFFWKHRATSVSKCSSCVRSSLVYEALDFRPVPMRGTFHGPVGRAL